MLGSSIAEAPIGATYGAFVAPPVEPPAEPTAAAPSTPLNVAATAGTNSISVAFQAPASDGGAAITGYPVKLSTGEQKTVTSSPAVFTGLSAGVARTAQVAASNAQYTSAYSAASNSVTPTAPVVVDPPTEGTIDATKVPSSRTVVFGGSIRVVNFPGNTRIVSF